MNVGRTSSAGAGPLDAGRRTGVLPHKTGER
jgi:hypothetical protein